ncbi:MAG: transposase [Phycisphaerales bacterium]
MPRFRRWFVPGGVYFFTLVTCRRKPILCTDMSRRCLRRALSECRRRWPFDLVAIVLLPDHLHLLVRLPPDDFEYPKRIAWMKQRFTRLWLEGGGDEVRGTVAQRNDRRRGVWQPRYWEHTVRDRYSMHRIMAYIHFNPVKHGYVRRPRDWPYSSFHRCVRQGLYRIDWGSVAVVKEFDLDQMESIVGE